MPPPTPPAARATGGPVIAAVVTAALLTLIFALYHYDKDLAARTAPVELTNSVADGTVVSVKGVLVRKVRHPVTLTVAEIRWTAPNSNETTASFTVPKGTEVNDTIIVYMHLNTGQPQLSPWPSETAEDSQGYALGGFLAFLALATLAYSLIRRRQRPDGKSSPPISTATQRTTTV